MRLLLEYKYVEMSQVDQLKHKLNAIKRALYTFGIMVALMITLHIGIYLISIYYPVKQDWISSMIKVCKEYESYSGGDAHMEVESAREYEKENLYANDMLYRLAYIRSSVIAIGFGAYIGICFDVVYLSGTCHKINVTKSLKKAVLRVIIVMAFSFALRFQTYYKYPKMFGNDYALDMVYNFIMSFLQGFILFSFMKVLFKKLHLVCTTQTTQFDD